VSDAIVTEIREGITAVDDELLSAFNRRLELATRMFEHKEANGIPIVDSGREDAMIARLTEENGGPLSAAGVGELFRYLLDLTKRELGRG
jgi:chorismate mutase